MSENRLTRTPDGSRTMEGQKTVEQPPAVTNDWIQQLTGEFENHGFIAQAQALYQIFVRHG